MKKILFAVLTLSTLNAFTQSTAKPDAYAKTITPADLKKHLFIVAGPEMEGRETATPGQKKAAAYIESQFKALGLQPGNNGSYQLQYDVFQDSLVDAKLEVNGQGFALDRDFNPNVANNIAGTMRFSEVVFAGSASADSLKNMNLTGRLVMILAGNGNNTNNFSNRGQMGGISSILASKGVAGILVVANNY